MYAQPTSVRTVPLEEFSTIRSVDLVDDANISLQPRSSIIILIIAIAVLLVSGCSETAIDSLVSSDSPPSSVVEPSSVADGVNPSETITNPIAGTAIIATPVAGVPVSGSVDSVSAVIEGAYHVVYTAESGFVPQRLDVPTGETVVFVNDSDSYVWPASNIHPTHAILPSFDPKEAIKPGDVWAYQFESNGHWLYHNHLEPSEGGLIVTSGGSISSIEGELLDMAVVDREFPEPPESAIFDYDLYDNDTDVRNFVKLYGPSAAVKALEEFTIATDRNSCHTRAHIIGNIAFEEFGASAFAITSHECTSGAYHGAIESLLLLRGTDDFVATIATVCSTIEDDPSKAECMHGVGHGILAWLSYELPDALDICDTLPIRYELTECYTGVFMENSSTSGSEDMGHTSKYINDDDPHYPCNILKEKHMPTCYRRQMAHVFRVLDNDFAKAAQTCFEAPPIAQRDCYMDYGRNLRQAITDDDPYTIITSCEYAPAGPHRKACIDGIISAYLSLTPGTDDAIINFCSLLDYDPEHQTACYTLLIQQAIYVQISQRVCPKLPESYQQLCVSMSQT